MKASDDAGADADADASEAVDAAFDAALDAPRRPDGAADLQGPDGPADARRPDFRPDGPGLDALVLDGEGFDLRASDGSSGACAATATTSGVGGWNQMVVCTESTAVTQCAAHLLCGSWVLCTASDYLARGGAAVAAPASAWIASCVRSSGPNTAPTDAICGDCDYLPGGVGDSAWNCQTGELTAVAQGEYVAVQADSTCNRIGVNRAQTAGYWQIASGYSVRLSAVCCAP